MKAAPEQPPRGPEAFAAVGDEAIQAQAAILLSIGAQLRGDRAALQAVSAAVARPTDMFLAETLDDFPIPRLVPASKRYPRQTLEEAAVPGRTLTELAVEVYRTRSTSAAAALATAAMGHPHELVRVSAAHAALPVTANPARPYRILVSGTHSQDELVRAVAATSLARYRPDDPALQRLIGEPRGFGEEPAHTSTLIHGTWAATSAWWQPPAGDFFVYVKQSVWPDLYDQNDRFGWSGGYSAGARDLAADRLVAWMQAKATQNLSLMAHSHGGSVVMLASWLGVRFGKIVLLSCPVHPATYSMNFTAEQKVVSIRVKLDLVLLADGSGFSFSDLRYNEHVLPIWFNHFATHDPAIWTRYGIPAML